MKRLDSFASSETSGVRPSLLGQLGKVALAQRVTTDARALFSESLELRQQVGDKVALIESLEGLASVAIGAGGCARRAPLWGG